MTYPLIINYIRDKRSPTPKSEAVSRVMSANRPRDTKPELALRQALRLTGHRGYRINYRPQLHKPTVQKPSVQKPARSKGTKGGNPTGRKGVPRVSSPHVSKGSVRPDITFVGRKLAIFVHGCYWHRCPKCNYPLPKNNTEFWQAKFDRNTARLPSHSDA
jgi:DNA mismatch endonuclease (patch repair protein)